MYVSPSIKDVLGFTPEEIVGRKFIDFLDPTSPLNAGVADCLKKRFRDNDTSPQSHLRVFETRNDNHKILQIQTHGVLGEDGELRLIHGLTQDITDLIFAEKAMHQRLVALEKFSLKLNQREELVLQAVKQGKLNKVIAKEIGVSERSIEKIRARLVEKFDAQTISEVISKSTELEVLKEVVLLGSGTESYFRTKIHPN